MPESPASAPLMPKTLAEAKGIISSLRKQLHGHGPPAGSKPIPKVDPQPSAGSDPVVPLPQDPHPVPYRTEPINPNNFNTKTLASLIERHSTADLLKMIRKSNDGRIMAAIRKELKDRGVA